MNFNKTTTIILLIAISLCTSVEAMNSKEYFTNLVNQRVESTDLVEWKNVGPGMSGYNETYICHPTDPNTLFLGPDMRVSYGSWDGGESWQTLKDCDGMGREMERVLDIEFSLINPDYGIALTRFGWPVSGVIYETFDRGRTWSKVSVIGKIHREIAIHPQDDKIIFAGAGDFWSVSVNHRSAKKIHGVKSKDGEYGCVKRSRDGGRTWEKVATNISDDLDVGRIIPNPNNGNEIVIATNYGVFKSLDCGDSWSKSGMGLANNLPRDLTIQYDPKSKKPTLFLVEQSVYEFAGKSTTFSGGVFRSDDFGDSWIDITGDLGMDLNKINDSSNTGGYKRSMAFWFSMPVNEFSSKYPELPTIAMPVWNRIVVNPMNPDEIYLAHNKRHDKSFGIGDVWKSENGGKNWFPTARHGRYWVSGKDADYWATKGIEPSMNMTFSHVQREMLVNNESGAGCRHLAINPKGDLFVGVAQQTLRSNDGGKSWMQSDDIELKPNSNQWIGRGGSDLPGRLILVNTGVPGRKLFCSGEHGLFKSVDLGDYPDKDAVAVEQIEGQVHPNGATSISTVAVHPKDPNTIYILVWRQKHRGTLRRSTDGGKTWENISTILVSEAAEYMGLAHQASLLIDPNDPNNMYFCTIRQHIQDSGSHVNSPMVKGDFGVYRSTDGGYNWEFSIKGLPKGCNIHRLTMDPKNPKRIYASLTKVRDAEVDGGLYLSTDGAMSWKRVTIPSEITAVNDLHISKRTGDYYISCGSRIGAPESGGVWRSTNGGKNWEKIFKAPTALHTEVSEANPNIVMVTAPAHRYGNRDFINPGVYLSLDNAKSWNKINRGLGQPNSIVEIKPDPEDESIVWCTSWGCGWFKGRINGIPSSM